MENRLDGIAAALDALAAAGGAQAPAALSPSALVEVNRAFGVLMRQVDAAFAPVAAEISRQSRPQLGGDSLAKKQGFRSPVALIQATTGASVGEAIRLVQVGESTAPRTSISGESRPAAHPHVAAAVAAGALSMTAASAIITLLDKLSLRVDSARRDAVERDLCQRAPGLRADELTRLLAHAEAELDPDGLAAAHEEHRSARALRMQERDGMLHLTGVFDVATAAPIKTVLDAMVTRVLQNNEHAPRHEHGGGDDPEAGALRDERTVPQMRADALHELCAHALGCEQVPTVATTTVVVRMTLDQLESGCGVARIDGFDASLPAAEVRRLAADLQVIPCVLGGDSEILDWGRTRRLFSPAQKLALAERDGGCAFCGAPPAWTHGHHIAWWNRDAGPTDLDNGVLLCTGCHHRIHSDGWEIRVDGVGVAARVWFIPPPWIDADRTPRIGGSARYALKC
ncbi:HNH endonuclease signature motif containing protein [Microbacterium sp. PM5]|uniref:HNH endonuclease n=1 Tax=Microbacterium sp. PM5 TaxID=2014534 RepID=UPI000DD120F3|nr:HNH endonuclease signature motif containing protein [Microbacterium sp. PM5]AXA97129.1 HNH endonuclease [Microbacterium sp. PM5]